MDRIPERLGEVERLQAVDPPPRVGVRTGAHTTRSGARAPEIGELHGVVVPALMSSTGVELAFAILFLAPGVALTVLVIAIGLAFWLVQPRPTGKFSGSRIGLAIAVGLVLTFVALVVLGQLIEGAHERSLRRSGALHDSGDGAVRVSVGQVRLVLEIPEDSPSGRRIDDRRAHWGAVQPPYRHEHTDECPDDAAAGSAAQSLRFHALIALISSEAKGMAGLFGAPEESEAVGSLCNSGTLAANPPAR